MFTVRRKLPKRAVTLYVASLLIMLSGCTVGPKYHAPAPQAPAPDYKESPTQFKENEGWTVAQPSDAKLRGKWWEIFNDPELNALEEQLDINNQNIKEFLDNFIEARTLIREARAQYWPTITTSPSWSRSTISHQTRMPSSPRYARRWRQRAWKSSAALIGPTVRPAPRILRARC